VRDLMDLIMIEEKADPHAGETVTIYQNRTGAGNFFRLVRKAPGRGVSN
jgi:hypothetical protein